MGDPTRRTLASDPGAGSTRVEGQPREARVGAARAEPLARAHESGRTRPGPTRQGQRVESGHRFDRGRGGSEVGQLGPDPSRTCKAWGQPNREGLARVSGMVESQPRGPREGVRVGFDSCRSVAPRGRRSTSDREGRAATPPERAEPTPGSRPSTARMCWPRPEGLDHDPDMSCARPGRWPSASLMPWPHRAGPGPRPAGGLVDDRGRAATLPALDRTIADPLPSIGQFGAPHARHARERLDGEFMSHMRPREVSTASSASNE